MPFKIKIAKDIDHAFNLIRNDRSGNFSKKHAIQKSEKPAVVNHEDIEKLMAIIGSINWEQEGIDTNFDMGEDHPFYFLCQSIKLIKEELDDLFKERKRLEKQLYQSRKMESIGTLAGGIAHDINNILGIILGNAELAMDDIPEWNPARLNLAEVKTASLRGKDVVRQLLSFARKTKQERKPVKINPIVTGALKLLRSSIPTSIEIRSNIPKDSAIILADLTQINQIMINLCTNAAHAMEEDGGVIEISLDSMILDESTAQSYKLSPGRYVKLTVGDTGHGIDPEVKDRIFDPYFTTREVGKGSGLGLAVVHGIVTNHDGAISVDSEVGKGSTFNVFFPIVKREIIPEITIDEALPTGKERILFIDDEDSMVKMGQPTP
jgi:signal transduction histidine kinase